MENDVQDALGLSQAEDALDTGVESDVDAIVAGSEVAAPDDTTETVLSPDPVDHPLMTTSFSDYTVTEGLLLLIFLALVLDLTVGRMLRGVF